MPHADDAPANPRRVGETTPLETSAQSQAEPLPSLREPVEEETLEAALKLFPAENPIHFMNHTVGWWQASTDPAPAVGAGLWPDTLPVRTPALELRAIVREKQITLERAPAEAHPRVPRSVEASAEERRLASPLAAEVRLLTETLERQRQAIDHGVVGASRVTDLLTTLETRISSFTNVAQTVANLELRAVEASTDLEQRVGEFESQRRRVEQTLSEATQLVDAVSAKKLLTTLETRISSFTNVAQTVADLELRAVEASTDLEQRVSEFESQRRRIERALSEASRLVDAVSALEQRLSALTESSGVLERAADQRRSGYRAFLTGFPRTGRAMVAARNALPAWAANRLSTWANRLPTWAASRARQGNLAIGAAAASLLVLIAFAPWRHASGHGTSPVHPEAGLISPTQTPNEARPGDDAASDAVLPDSQTSPTVDASRLPGPSAEHARDSAAADASGGARRTSPRAASAATTRESNSGESAQGVPTHNFTGDLTIESEPARATVFINQKRVGETPVHLKALRAGSLAVRIERDGYERWTAGVLVAAEQQTRVSAKLERSR